MVKTQRGTGPYRRALAALTLLALSTFSLIYVVQPSLVLMSQDFGVNAGTTSLTLSIATLTLALSVIPIARAAGSLGRSRVIAIAATVAVVASALSALAPTLTLVLAARALAGMGFAGVTGVALAWVAEEASPVDAARIGGLYVAGTTVGGMNGRLLGGFLAEIFGWRGSILGVTVLCAMFVVIALVMLPRPGAMAQARGETLRRPLPPQGRGAAPAAAATRLALWRLYTVGGVGMFAFVGVFTAIVFRAAGPPYHLGPAITSLFFLAYLAGTLTSAQAGAIAARIGVRPAMVAGMAIAVLGVSITIFPSPIAIWVGLLTMSAGFFLSHALASSTGPRISPSPAAASGRYTFAYYAGSSLGGVLIGLAWDVGGWPLVAATAMGAFTLAALAALGLRLPQGIGGR